MKDIFTPKLHPKVRPNDFHNNTITYCTKSLKTLGPKTWNQLPEDIKSETSSAKFKEPNLRNKLTLGLDVNVDVMCAWIFEPLSVKMCDNHWQEDCHVF